MVEQKKWVAEGVRPRDAAGWYMPRGPTTSPAMVLPTRGGSETCDFVRSVETWAFDAMSAHFPGRVVLESNLRFQRDIQFLSFRLAEDGGAAGGGPTLRVAHAWHRHGRVGVAIDILLPTDDEPQWASDGDSPDDRKGVGRERSLERQLRETQGKVLLAQEGVKKERRDWEERLAQVARENREEEEQFRLSFYNPLVCELQRAKGLLTEARRAAVATNAQCLQAYPLHISGELLRDAFGRAGAGEFSVLQERVYDASWSPFHVVVDEKGCAVRRATLGDAFMQNVEACYGPEAATEMLRAKAEQEEENAPYGVAYPWCSAEDRALTPAEVIAALAAARKIRKK